MRSVRIFGLEVSRPELQDNEAIAAKIYSELYEPACKMAKKRTPSDWRSVIEFCHPIFTRKDKNSSDGNKFHIICKFTTRFHLQVVLKNWRDVFAPLNTGCKAKQLKVFLQRDTTSHIRAAMSYLRSHDEVNAARVYVADNGRIGFHRHGEADGTPTTFCGNYLRRPLSEMILRQ